ncbi:MAG: glycerate kinase [Pseudomonadota bacterium]
MIDPKSLLREMFDAALAAAMPDKVIADHLPEPPMGRVVVVGAGKASAAMARAFERAWDGPLEGLVVTRYDHAVPCERIEIVEASHPVPDAAGAETAARILDLAQGLGADDLLVALISGGGSSLLSVPAPGVSLHDKQALNAALLASGASIGEMNCIRKHVSGIKGGRLAAAAFPARCVTLVISDVPGDDPADIASGPTVADATTLDDACALVERYGMTLPESVHVALADPRNETPKPGSEALTRAETHSIAAPQASLEAAAAVARDVGVTPIILGDAIEGEAREVGTAFAGIAKQVRQHAQPLPAPCVILSGGETTVTIPKGSTGRGGRNVEFLMGLTEALEALPDTYAIACDTDGIDGLDPVAGAVVSPDTLARAAAAGYPVADALGRFDGHGFFARLGDQVITGPTLTNVNDFRAILVL